MMHDLQSGTKQIMIKNYNLDLIAYVIVEEFPESMKIVVAHIMGFTNHIKKTCIASIFFCPCVFLANKKKTTTKGQN